MKILVGYKGAEDADSVLELTKKYAKAFDAEVHVVTSLVKAGDDDPEDIEKGERELEYAKSVMTEAGIPCITHLLIRGMSAGEDITQFAKENDIDEIIIGVKKRSKVGKFVFGSTSQYVILESSCPVVTTR